MYGNEDPKPKKSKLPMRTAKAKEIMNTQSKFLKDFFSSCLEYCLRPNLKNFPLFISCPEEKTLIGNKTYIYEVANIQVSGVSNEKITGIRQDFAMCFLFALQNLSEVRSVCFITKIIYQTKNILSEFEKQ